MNEAEGSKSRTCAHCKITYRSSEEKRMHNKIVHQQATEIVLPSGEKTRIKRVNGSFYCPVKG
jgi:hypothetical protein